MKHLASFFFLSQQSFGNEVNVHFLIASATGRQDGAIGSALLSHPDFKIAPNRV
jgi:hypothetical protein